MRLGSRDPSFLYHAGMIAAGAGEASRRAGCSAARRAEPALQPALRAARAAGAGGPGVSRRRLRIGAAGLACVARRGRVRGSAVGRRAPARQLHHQPARPGADTSDRDAQVHYILDQAEIPTFQQLQRYDATAAGDHTAPEAGPVLQSLLGDLLGLALTANGRTCRSAPPGPAASASRPARAGCR